MHFIFTPPQYRVRLSYILASIVAVTLSAMPRATMGQSSGDFGIPDSAYIPNQIIVWFNSGALNLEMLGGYGDLDDYPFSDAGTESLPLDTTLILNQDLVTYLDQRGVIDIHKVVPWIDPFRDTLSITRRGDTVNVSPIWNMLLLEFDSDSEIDPVYESYILVAQYYRYIKWAQPNFLFHAAANPGQDEDANKFHKTAAYNDPWWQNQFSLSNSAKGTFVEDAWSFNTGNDDIRIAIQDNGLQTNNPDFTNKLAHAQVDYDKSWTGMRNHGTEMAGIIGAKTDNNEGVSGIAGGDKNHVGPLLVIQDVESGTFQYGTAALANALEAAAIQTTQLTSNGNYKGEACHVISMSMANRNGIPDADIRRGIAYAYAHGVIVCAAMGNDHTYNSIREYPSDVDEPYVIAVGAKAETYARAGYSNYGPNIDFMAPGHDRHIYTTVGVGYDWTLGQTSAATAHASGIAALIISEYNNSVTNVDKPYDPEDIENLMEAGCVDGSGNIRGIHDDEKGWGFLNAYNSLLYLHDPYVLKHYSHTEPVMNLPAATQTLSEVIFFEDLLNRNTTQGTFGLRDAEVYEIRATATYPDNFQSVVRTWGRGNQEWNREGVGPVRLPQGSTVFEPIFQLGYDSATSWTAATCELKTYFYKGSDHVTGITRWAPYNPEEDSVRFYYSVLGIPAPVSVPTTQGIANNLQIVSLYPNPVVVSKTPYTHLSFSFSTMPTEGNILLTDFLGRVVRRVPFAEYAPGELIQKLVPVSGLPSGMYLLTIQGGSRKVSRTVSILN